MATVRDIVKRAFQMAKVVAVGDDPTADESQAGLDVLQSYYLRLADTALRPVPVYVTDDYTADEGERVYGEGLTLSLPDVIADSGDRLPNDLACVQLNDGTGWATHISDRGTWVQVDNLTLNSVAPFAGRNAEGLAALLATELVDTFGGEITPAIDAKARRFRTQMQPVDLTPNEYY
jgi:hypothetical protein